MACQRSARILSLPQLPQLLLWLAAAALCTQAGAASLDTEKLRLLSCVVPTPSKATPDQRAAMRWLYSAGNTTDGMSFNVAGPVRLGKACLRHVKVSLGASWQVEGEVCNALDEFSAALGDAGVKLAEDGAGSLQAREKDFQYDLSAQGPGGAFHCTSTKRSE